MLANNILVLIFYGGFPVWDQHSEHFEYTPHSVEHRLHGWIQRAFFRLLSLHLVYQDPQPFKWLLMNSPVSSPHTANSICKFPLRNMGRVATLSYLSI